MSFKIWYPTDDSEIEIKIKIKKQSTKELIKYFIKIIKEIKKLKGLDHASIK